jgi:uncharacterized membrane protein YhaH (DUF805 family)
MDFKQAVLRCVRDKYAEFNGRASRSEFWWFALATSAVGLALSILNLNIIALLFNLAVIVPSLAVGARRLHDIGKSGWFQLIWLIPLIGWAILIYWLVQPSGDPNEYGEGPAQPELPAAMPPGAA